MIMMSLLKRIKIILILGVTIILFSVNAFAVDLQEKTELLINRLSSVLPDQWRLEKVDNPEKPWWMIYNKSESIEIRLVGPKGGGLRYELQSGETKDIFFLNEAIYLWIVPLSFDDGWTLWRRFRYRSSITYTKLPDVIPTKFGLKIYALPGWVGEAHHPKNSRGLRQIHEKRSWSNWKDDIAKAVK